MSEANDTITITNTSGYPGLSNDPLLKIISSLNLEAKLKKMEMERLHSIIRKDKHKYNNELQIYNSINNDIIETEEKIEDIQRQMSKNKFKMLMFYSTLTSTFYNQLIENCTPSNYIFITYLFLFCGFGNPNNFSYKKNLKHNQFLFLFNTVVKNEDEFISLISSGESFQKQLCNDDYGTFAELRNKIKILTTYKTIPYPFEPIFSHMLVVYDWLSLESKQKKIEIERNNHAQYKNAIFLGLKVLEGNIIQSDTLYHELDTYIKEVQGLMDKYKDMKQLHSKSAYEEFKKTIKDFQSANWKIGNELDRDLLQITSAADLDFVEQNMAFQGEFSEDSSNNSVTNSGQINKLTMSHIPVGKNEEYEETCEKNISMSEEEEDDDEEEDTKHNHKEKELYSPKIIIKTNRTKVFSSPRNIAKSPKAISPILHKSQSLLLIKNQKTHNSNPILSNKNISNSQVPRSLFNKFFYVNSNKNINSTIKNKKCNNSKLKQTSTTLKTCDNVYNKSAPFIMNISNKKPKQSSNCIKNKTRHSSKKCNKYKNNLGINKSSSIQQNSTPSKNNLYSTNTSHIDMISNITDLTIGGITFEQYDNESVCEELSPMHKAKMNPLRLILKGPYQKEMEMCDIQVDRNITDERENLQIENKVKTPGCCMSCT